MKLIDDILYRAINRLWRVSEMLYSEAVRFFSKPGSLSLGVLSSGDGHALDGFRGRHLAGEDAQAFPVSD